MIGVAVLASNAVAATWGGVAWTRRDPSTVFWYLLRFAQATVAVQAVIGVVLLAQGRHGGSLHYVYGIAPLVVSLVCEGARVGVAQSEVERLGRDVDTLERREQVLLARRVVLREIGVMTIGAILTVTLGIRAATTG